MTNRPFAMPLRGLCTIACAGPAYLVDADRLADRIEDENLVLLDVTSLRSNALKLAVHEDYLAQACEARRPTG